MISVIIPIYNAAQYLQPCLDSVLRQTYTHLEIILINDGSTDRSGEICEYYRSTDNRIKYICQPNGGEAEARNRGLKIASGEYIAFIDSDDSVHPRYFEYLHRAINESGCAMAMVLYQETKSRPDAYDYISDIPYETSPLPNERLLDELYRSMRIGEIDGKPLGVVWGKLYRRELLEGLFFKKLVVSCDIEYSVRVCRKAGPTIVVTQKMYRWIYHPDSLSHNNSRYKSEKLLSRMDLWPYILENTPADRPEQRAICLEMLFRKIAHADYANTNGGGHSTAIRSKVKEYGRLYRSEFRKNRYIPLKQRIVFSLFYDIPVLYRLVRRTMESLSARRSSIKQP